MRKAKIMRIERPEEVTVGDALLAYQMGYRSEVSNGKLTALIKEEK